MVLCVAVLTSLACGSEPPAGPQDTRRTSSFSGTLDDPRKCTCDEGARTFSVRSSAAGRIDMVATVQPADAKLVVRLLDNGLDTVYAVSVQQGATARLSFDAPPATYAVQVFLASDGPRHATFTLEVTYP
jgi:hypothetical protein